MKLNLTMQNKREKREIKFDFTLYSPCTPISIFDMLPWDLRFLPVISIMRPQLCRHAYFSLMAGHETWAPSTKAIFRGQSVRRPDLAREHLLVTAHHKNEAYCSPPCCTLCLLQQDPSIGSTRKASSFCVYTIFVSVEKHELMQQKGERRRALCTIERNLAGPPARHRARHQYFQLFASSLFIDRNHR